MRGSFIDVGAAKDWPWRESLRTSRVNGGGTTSDKGGNPGLVVVAAVDCMRRLVFRISLRVQVRDCLRPSLVTSIPIDFDPVSISRSNGADRSLPR